MKNNRLKLPVLIIVIGLIVAVAAQFLTSMRLKPAVTEQDFAYSVTYKVDGEEKTLQGVYTCRFDTFGDGGIDPLSRYYVGEYTFNGVASSSHRYTIAEKDGYVLDIITSFNDCYLMGDTKNDSYNTLSDPCLEAMDAEGYQYSEEELPDVFDAEIVRWDYPQPVENRFVFCGFSEPHIDSMGAMLLAGLLTLIVGMIFVKKKDGVEYSLLDKVGVVANFAIGLVVLPFFYLTACLIQAYPTGPDWIYTGFLLVPPIMAFSLAASVSLRRHGFRRSGFFIQFVGIALLVILSGLEFIL